MHINLISDTVTKPTNEMRTTMFSANVGDDVFEEDPSVQLLQTTIADYFGKECALFFHDSLFLQSKSDKHLISGIDFSRRS